MTTATARPQANRRDSLRSTGPRTAADQAARRPDAFPPGLVGPGDGGGSGRDEAVIARRAEAFGRELRAVGTLGLLLARRAAVLSVRMEHLATGELLAVAAAEERGRAEFDAERAATIAEWLAAARTPGGDPAGALGDLLACPDGLAGLIEAWRDLGTRLRSSAPAEHPDRGGSQSPLKPRRGPKCGQSFLCLFRAALADRGLSMG